MSIIKEIKEMKKMCHSLNCDGTNPYHGEETIWNHTKLVLIQTLIFLIKYGVSKRFIDIFISGFFHDIGKVFKKEIFEKKNGTKAVRFEKHWFYSANYFINWYLNNKIAKLLLGSDKKRIYNIYKTIALHHKHKFSKKLQSNLYLDLDLNFLKIFNPFKYCDVYGRISDKKINFHWIYNSKLNNTKDVKIIKKYSDIKSIFKKYKNDKILIIPIGAPASGKSYLYNNFLKNKFIRIGLDLIRIKLYNKKYNTNYKYDNIDSKIYNKIHQNINKEELIKEFNEQLKINRQLRKNIYIDNTNTFMKYRKQILSQFGSYKKIAIFFLFNNYEEILKRNKNRNITINEEILKKYYYEKEIPLFAEGFDEIIII